MSDPGRRIGYVDGLRAIAVLIVVASHALPTTTIGQFGVELFFVVSGFCLSYPTLIKLQERGNANFDVYRYSARRIVRIVPPYWIAIAVLFTGAMFLPELHRVSPRDAIAQALFFDKGIDLINGSFWTLPIEFRWYFVFPLALWLWVKRPRLFFLTALVAIVIGPATTRATYDLLELPAFMSGIVAAHLSLKEYSLSKFALPACVLLAATVGLIVGGFTSPMWHTIGFMPVVVGMMFLFVVGSGSISWASRALSMKWLTAVGLASYSIYLVHGPVMAVAESHGMSPWLAALLGIGSGFAFWGVAERPFVEAKLRVDLVSRLENAFLRWFSRSGTGVQLALKDRAHCD
ncbi:MAG: acyltransferase [Candidatus Cybelea sp.]